MFRKVMVANRGAIAVRIFRTLRQLGISSVAVYAHEDRDSLHVSAADEAYSLGAGPAKDTYLDKKKLLSIAQLAGVQAVHPGYGFLSENGSFAETLASQGVAFIGPRPNHLEQFGLKHVARRLAVAAGVNLLPGSEVLSNLEHALEVAGDIGYPVMLKSTAGGGGIGMQCCKTPEELEASFPVVSRLAAGNFGNAEVFLEKFVANPRHIEVQVFGDGKGAVAVIGDRDCSLQRRHQKVIEECPAPGLPAAVRASLHDQAQALLQSVSYESAGTVEFLYSAESQEFYFLEVNTRLQVEHGVTELVHGVDLVAWMVRQTAGEVQDLAELETLQPSGHAIQARVYAEDPNHDFRPTPGKILLASFPDVEGVRIDTWVRSGTDVPFQYDPLLAKVITHRDSREQAIAQLDAMLGRTAIHGIETNLRYLQQALRMATFRNEQMSTSTLSELQYSVTTIDVLAPGASTTVQSFPGRQGYWAVGVPPSGPMDDLSFCLGNRLLGNPVEAAGLEVVLNGPTLVFNTAARCVVTGADIDVELDEQCIPLWMPFDVVAGQTLTIGTVVDGMRSYLCFQGGLDTPVQLGSSATFTLGQMGGFTGSALRTGDVLRLSAIATLEPLVLQQDKTEPQLPSLAHQHQPVLRHRHQIRVMLGPHVAPDYFTEEDIDRFLADDWTVHYNSSRTGVRLTGPQPQWARPDGGEAGLHPSNIHDNAYAFGSVDFTGDMPVILGPDGPSLGGFVCPAVVINADRWKLGQLVPGDRIRFVTCTEADARGASERRESYLDTLIKTTDDFATQRESPVVLAPAELYYPDRLTDTDVAIRRAGQEWLLIEFGAPVLDVALHLKVHTLRRLIERDAIDGIIEMTPGIRSLQIRYDFRRWNAKRLTDRLAPLLAELPLADAERFDSRIVRLPLSWEDPACLEAVERYVKGVRQDAPWCPDNVEFIRRINGLGTKDDVKKIVFDASYLVMGLGDVYLGAPVATPLDPRHRLVTTKYNPARTWTAENSVGIGGSYLCIYGMEGPGGYQFVGRTLQVWNTHQQGAAFTEPWLLRPFDQLQFYPVDAQTLVEMREQFARGEPSVEFQSVTFDASAYADFLEKDADSIERFTSRRQQAFDEEVARWRQDGLMSFDTDMGEAPMAEDITLPEGAVAVDSPMSGSVWALPAQESTRVDCNDSLVVIEAMKSEFEVRAPLAGSLKILVKTGQQITAGQTLAVLQPD